MADTEREAKETVPDDEGEDDEEDDDESEGILGGAEGDRGITV